MTTNRHQPPTPIYPIHILPLQPTPNKHSLVRQPSNQLSTRESTSQPSHISPPNSHEPMNTLPPALLHPFSCSSSKPSPPAVAVPAPLTNVGVFEFPQQGDLPDGRARRALLVLQPNLLQRHDPVRDQSRLALVHGGVGALRGRQGRSQEGAARAVVRRLSGTGTDTGTDRQDKSVPENTAAGREGRAERRKGGWRRTLCRRSPVDTRRGRQSGGGGRAAQTGSWSSDTDGDNKTAATFVCMDTHGAATPSRGATFLSNRATRRIAAVSYPIKQPHTAEVHGSDRTSPLATQIPVPLGISAAAVCTAWKYGTSNGYIHMQMTTRQVVGLRAAGKVG